ncbi:hypothetical protein EUTSA_v10001309mg [Eutrema salsugineum]|uniref:Glycosyl transferase CAP10 domain-containing protein n=1 Tax=Eutrema salsugineum TaxID=72664 RepID=V4KMT8_EUTSA|nr:hypothetical protein EUTSA_v10001309mg [Eutrema salsugineum]
MLEKARRTAHFRVIILDGKVYVKKYRKSIQTRDVFTLWGIVQLLRWYPGRLPDLELMFDADDRPTVRSKDFKGRQHPAPPPLFRYCSDDASLDIVFPDWSFWGWAEANIKPWAKSLVAIEDGSKMTQWKDRVAYAYWRGNPHVAPTRRDLLRCNVSAQEDWNTRLYIQDWVRESREGFKNSNLENQCTHRYKIYIEGWAWSVSEKYIMACDSMTLYVRPKFYDFYIRGMMPLQHYWPIRDKSKCTSLKYAVHWGNTHLDQARKIGEEGSRFIREEVKMEYVYDYMFHLMNEYANLLKFKPEIPWGATEITPDSMGCPATGRWRDFMAESMVMFPSEVSPCEMPLPYNPLELREVLERKANLTRQFLLSGSRIKVTPIFSRNTNVNIPKNTLTPPLNYTLQCSLYKNITKQTCPASYPEKADPKDDPETCPDYFRWIHKDLEPWRETGITRETLERASDKAHFRLIIKGGRVYVHQYMKSFQTRDVFTIWGIVQLLRMYPGQVPDLELLFLCHDFPEIWRRDYRPRPGVNVTWPPPPLFHYCGHAGAFDIVFPDWSFWGCLNMHMVRPEINVKEWNKLSEAISEGAKKVKWEERKPYAYWKGNPGVAKLRRDLMKCHDPMVHLYHQNWRREGRIGFRTSNLEDQCTHRYKIYVEGRAWSVSEKYILACDSMTLLIKPFYFDFFTRSLVPMEHYWPIRPREKCSDIIFAVHWGNNNTKKAKTIGRNGSEYVLKNLQMKYVYDYMLYLLQSYGKLMNMNVQVPEGAKEVCSEIMACPINGGRVRQCMGDSLIMFPSVKGACEMPPPFEEDELKKFLEKKKSVEKEVEKWTNEYWEEQKKKHINITR